MKLDITSIKPVFHIVGLVIIAIQVVKIVPGVNISTGADIMSMAAVGAACVWAGK